MNTRALAVVAVLALGLGCGGTEPSPPVPPPPPPPPPATNTITVASNSFSPQTLNATVRGATVTWNWAGGTHNVTFEDNQGNGPTQSSGSLQRTFSSPGTFRYQCTIHSTAGNFTSGMVGSVVVP